MSRIVCVCLSMLLWACQSTDSTTQTADKPSNASKGGNVSPVNDFRVMPGQRVGPIRYSTSEADLLRLLGPDVVTTGDTVYGAEGEEFIGTTLYKDTADQLQILYQDSSQRQHPELILIRPYSTDADGNPLPSLEPTRWATADGLRIGTTLTELERRNGKSFRLWGFEWDYGGAVSSWQGGRLDAGEESLLALTLAPGLNLTSVQSKALNKVLGDGEFMSSDKAMQALNPSVQVMQVTLQP
jgi:hypothetical protein